MKHELTAKRLSKALSDKGIKPQELSDKSGVSKSSISQYINGSHKPSNISAGKMANVLDVNPMWLMGFDVSMEIKEIAQQRNIESFINTKDEKLLIDIFRGSSEMTKARLLAYAARLSVMSNNTYSDPVLNAAHAIPNSSEEDKQYDEDIMNDENF